jgi:hypothetical protein
LAVCLPFLQLPLCHLLEDPSHQPAAHSPESLNHSLLAQFLQLVQMLPNPRLSSRRSFLG